MQRKLRRATGVLVLALVALTIMAGQALAHVTLRVDNNEAGGFAVYTVRVPNESAEASTISVTVEMPEGFTASRYEPEPGWDITLEDNLLTIEGGEIGVGEFMDFRFQARNPEEPGTLTFLAVQTYDDGEVREWVELDEEAESPAPTVELVAAAPEGEEGEDAAATEAGTETEAETAEDEGSDSGSGDGPVYAAIALGALGLVAGVGGLVSSRRR